MSLSNTWFQDMIRVSALNSNNKKILFERFEHSFFSFILNLRSLLMKLLHDIIFFGFFDVKTMKKICHRFF